MTVETVVLAPVVMLFVLLIVGGARYELARQQVAADARAGAQAASAAPDAAAAERGAALAASSAGPGPGQCVTRSVRVDVSQFTAAGSVSVSVACRVELSQVFFPGTPGTCELRATQSAPIDRYRSVG